MKINLKQQSREEAQLRRWAGSGWRYPFTLGDSEGELLLLPDNQQVCVELHYYHSDGGLLALTDPAPLLGLLADCPLLTATQDNENWYWPFFNQQLSAQIAGLLGHISPATPCDMAGACALRLEVTLGERRARSQLVLLPGTLRQWARHPDWQPLYQPLPATFPLTLPLVVGRLSLSLERLCRLGRGDVLIPPHPLFTPEGTGIVSCVHGQFQGQLIPATQPTESTLFHIIQKEEPGMSDPHEPLLPEEGQEPSTAFTDLTDEHAWPERNSIQNELHALPLELTLRCGNLRLTLGELQQLDAGSTIMVDHVTPGEAVLCHGSFVLAKGELVNVNGNLGFQVIHMFSRRYSEGDGAL